MQSKAQDGDLHATVASVRSRWERSAFSVDELAQALVNGRVAGPITSHDRRNVLNRIERLVLGDPDVQFGLSGLTVLTPREVLALVAEEAGFDPDPGLTTGPSPIDPYRVLEACRRSGQRLAAAADRGERVLLATGHPAGLLVLYQAIAALLEAFGAKLLRPLIGLDWREEGKHREVRYLQGVAVLTDRASTRHTHAPVPMEWMLEKATPDLVVADHGFAGAAIELGIDTLSVADVNDPALVVAKHLGMTETVIVMDDNVQPEDYWPCYQAVAAEFP